MLTLLDIVASLHMLGLDATIYARKPWHSDTPAVVVREPEAGGIPSEAEEIGAIYFIEVSIAKEFLEGWMAGQKRPCSAREQCERLIHYAIYDA